MKEQKDELDKEINSLKAGCVDRRICEVRHIEIKEDFKELKQNLKETREKSEQHHRTMFDKIDKLKDELRALITDLVKQ